MELRPNLPIETERLRLRALRADDLSALLAYRSDPEVCRYLPFEPMDEDQVAKRIASEWSRVELTAEGEVMTLAIERRDDGRVIGDVVLFFRSQSDRKGEIGYVLHPGAAGQGFATEACGAILNLAFDEMGLHRVIALMDARNERSALLAERLGMRREAHQLEDEWFKGEWSDTFIYAILDREWRASRPG